MIGWAISAGVGVAGLFVFRSWRKDAAIKSGEVMDVRDLLPEGRSLSTSITPTEPKSLNLLRWIFNGVLKHVRAVITNMKAIPMQSLFFR